MFVLPKGIELILPVWSRPWFMVPHIFVGNNALWITPTQYHYRYTIIRGYVDFILQSLSDSVHYLSLFRPHGQM